MIAFHLALRIQCEDVMLFIDTHIFSTFHNVQTTRFRSAVNLSATGQCQRGKYDGSSQPSYRRYPYHRVTRVLRGLE